MELTIEHEVRIENEIISNQDQDNDSDSASDSESDSESDSVIDRANDRANDRASDESIQPKQDGQEPQDEEDNSS